MRGDIPNGQMSDFAFAVLAKAIAFRCVAILKPPTQTLNKASATAPQQGDQ